MLLYENIPSELSRQAVPASPGILEGLGLFGDHIRLSAGRHLIVYQETPHCQNQILGFCMQSLSSRPPALSQSLDSHFYLIFYLILPFPFGSCMCVWPSLTLTHLYFMFDKTHTLLDSTLAHVLAGTCSLAMVLTHLVCPEGHSLLWCSMHVHSTEIKLKA